MKIALIIPSLSKGGAERTVSNLSLAMQDEHDVSVIVLDSQDQQYPHGGKLIDLGTPPSSSGALGKVYMLLKRAYRLKKLFKKEKYDGVFAFMEAAGLPAAIASKEVFVSVRDTPEKLAGFYPKLIKYIYPRAKKVIAVAKATEQKLVNHYGLTKTTTIYNMANIDMAAELSTADIDIKQPFILAVGRLNKQKGFDFLIKAYAASKAKDHINLLILGDGPEQEALQKLIDDNQLNDKATLYGSSNNPFAFYAKADFFVLSSRHEGFPNILIEALACHAACIAVDCPTGPNEIITPNENGLLIPTENIPELTKAIDQLYFDNALKAKFRKNAQASVKYLSPEAIAQQWVDLIEAKQS
ncbi:MAG: glycosyltransferase [Thiotrichaceae bacterium]